MYKILINYNEGGRIYKPCLFVSILRTGEIKAEEMSWIYSFSLSEATGKKGYQPHYVTRIVGKDTRLHLTFLLFWFRKKLIDFQPYIPFTGKLEMYKTQEEINEMKRWKEYPKL
jgi:hypothetical protein